MIPKTIHYFWFGPKKKNRVIRKCIASWKKLNPDFEIIEWNESNFDVNMNSYTQRCYREKSMRFCLTMLDYGLYTSMVVSIWIPM